MKEHPQLLNAWQVRAILDGRKTMIRIPTGRQGDLLTPVPRYAVGDLIWGREAFCDLSRYMGAPAFTGRQNCVAYRADDEFIGCHKWRPAIHMPRWASRITLEITGVRVERLLDIGLDDLKAEGVTLSSLTNPMARAYSNFKGLVELWESIHGRKSLYANPWVQVITFRRVDGTAALGAAA